MNGIAAVALALSLIAAAPLSAQEVPLPKGLPQNSQAFAYGQNYALLQPSTPAYFSALSVPQWGLDQRFASLADALRYTGLYDNPHMARLDVSASTSGVYASTSWYFPLFSQK